MKYQSGSYGASSLCRPVLTMSTQVGTFSLPDLEITQNKMITQTHKLVLDARQSFTGSYSGQSRFCFQRIMVFDVRNICIDRQTDRQAGRQTDDRQSVYSVYDTLLCILLDIIKMGNRMDGQTRPPNGAPPYYHGQLRHSTCIHCPVCYVCYYLNGSYFFRKAANALLKTCGFTSFTVAPVLFDIIKRHLNGVELTSEGPETCNNQSHRPRAQSSQRARAEDPHVL